VEIDDAHSAQLAAKYPFYVKQMITKDSYNGMTADAQTVAIKATFIVSNKLSEDSVYKLTKALIESKSEIVAAHVKGNELSAENAVSGMGGVPFHPGAAKYYREIGAIKN
jgi:TRAP transporter TAXI family solute receptor